MTIHFEVPATLSNLGPGFDVLGMALDWTNAFTFEAADAWRAEGKVVAPSQHLALQTALLAGERFEHRLPGMAVQQEERIPRARGLGSSATARVAGLLAWRAISGVHPPLPELLDFLTEQEGHPDNALPAMLGGLVICGEGDEGRVHLRLSPPRLRIALCIPEVQVSTEEARAILPQTVPRQDAIFNTGHIALLVAGLLTEDPRAVALGLADRLHQPWRQELIGPVPEAFAAAREAGALGAFISGSGSTLAAFVGAEVDAGAVAQAMAAPFVQAGIPCDSRVARPSSEGAARWASTKT